MKIGYKLIAEAFGPQELVRQAVRAEQAGFDFVEMSDHFHPWVEAQGHSPFVWSVLSAIAAKTTTLGIATGVTCPSVRYHPAIIAQAAATLALISDGRFTLGVGSGERLNEHIVGRGFPGVHERHAVFQEALEIIRLLWQGGYQNYDGTYLKLEDARIFDLPDELPTLAVAVSGPDSIALAAEHGDGLFAVEPKNDLVTGYRDAGGTGPLYCEAPLAWADHRGSRRESRPHDQRLVRGRLEGAGRTAESRQLRGRGRHRARRRHSRAVRVRARRRTPPRGHRRSSPMPASTTSRS